MALILAFSGMWILLFRREYRFPRALLLLPIGMAMIFILNLLRIAALLSIGSAGFPEVAKYGFHSQAGWITFIAAACGLILFSRRIVWFAQPAPVAPLAANATRAMDVSEKSGESNPTTLYLLPLMAILATGMLARALSGRFDLFYPLRLLVGLAVLYSLRRQLIALDWRCSGRGVAVGVAVAVIWLTAAAVLLPRAAPPIGWQSLSPGIRLSWLGGRVLAAILTVPLAEELAYRGFLMRWLQTQDFEHLSFRQVRWPALMLSSIIFGLGHGALWPAGIVAGAALALLATRTGSLGDSVLAHATANALIVMAAIGGGHWELW
jgi:exosortase E/protease (VPEID-CTERM system)